MPCSVPLPGPCSGGPVEVGIFCALHTYGRQLNQHPHIHVSVTRGGLCVKHCIWKDIFFKKDRGKKSGALLSLSYCGTTMNRLSPPVCRAMVIIRDEKQWRRYLDAQYGRY
ncbi:transposase [Escherichia sp. E4702]|uniref:transposase n=1 Tax=Escherichia sp. E4702 TaxID=2044465 RepID=UPI001F0DFA67|nr:transposase [Escherichia sp. E4702]